MKQEQINIQAKDGICKAWVVKPEGEGTWPAVIVYSDAFGLRPGMVEVASHIAHEGYVVLLPDLFYRYGDYGPYDPRELMKGEFRSIIGPLMASTDNLKAAEDTASFLAYLDSRQDVAGQKIGIIGFCMGGGVALTVAGTYPERVAAAASFHGGRLVTDLPTSPHLFVPRINGEVYIAGADQDASYPPEMAQRLEQVLTESKVRHKSEIYAGKKHGWMKPDHPAYDAEGAKRGWKELFALFARNLK